MKKSQTQESLDAVQALFSNMQNVGLLSALVWPQIQGTAPHGLLWRKLPPSRPGQDTGLKAPLCAVTEWQRK